ncbi:MAG TPA: hypothetical protein VJ818_05215, partial [Actinomycetota bacterium]|nr:hypothetical protein [Actinomycetota bacterium]
MRRIVFVAVLAGALVVPIGVARAGGGCYAPTPTERTGTRITYQDFCPNPTILHVKVGQLVTW